MIFPDVIYMVLSMRYEHNGILAFWTTKEGAQSNVDYNNKMRGNKYDHDIREIYVPENTKEIYTLEWNCTDEESDNYRYEIITKKD